MDEFTYTSNGSNISQISLQADRMIVKIKILFYGEP
jgi:hypothetical protein